VSCWRGQAASRSSRRISRWSGAAARSASMRGARAHRGHRGHAPARARRPRSPAALRAELAHRALGRVDEIADASSSWCLPPAASSPARPWSSTAVSPWSAPAACSRRFRLSCLPHFFGASITSVFSDRSVARSVRLDAEPGHPARHDEGHHIGAVALRVSTWSAEPGAGSRRSCTTEGSTRRGAPSCRSGPGLTGHEAERLGLTARNEATATGRSNFFLSPTKAPTRSRIEV